MKYYSEQLKKLFDTEADLTKAEQELKVKQEEQTKLAEAKKVRATEVEEAFKKTLDARKEAKEIIRKADEAYEQLKAQFIKDYGYFHMSFNDVDGKQVVTVNDLLEDFLGNFPFIW